MSNSFGRLFRITTFGESHGAGVGVVVDGCPAGLPLNAADVQAHLDRRRPGQSRLTSQRREPDAVQILSGWFEGRTTGTPLTLFIPNADAKSADYDHLRNVYRPSHADFTYQTKYGLRDHRGGGRSSARETAARVAAGAVATQFLAMERQIRISTWVESVADCAAPRECREQFYEQNEIDATPARCPHPETALLMTQRIDAARKAGDTLGGTVFCRIQNVPAGWGEPVFDKLHARLAYAMLGINAARGFEYGSGFGGALMRGSQHNDPFIADDAGNIRTQTNHSGGIQGGISNSEDIYFRVAFKPVATLMRPQTTVDIHGQPATVEGRGRHDPCVLPRAVPIVQAMAALVLADFCLLAKTTRF